MSVWPWKRSLDNPDYGNNSLNNIEFDDFAGFSDDEGIHDKYPMNFEDIYDPRFDDFYQ